MGGAAPSGGETLPEAEKERPVFDWPLLFIADSEKVNYFTAIPNTPMPFSSVFRVALRRRKRGAVSARRQVV
jgi:hypothetical protein